MDNKLTNEEMKQLMNLFCRFYNEIMEDINKCDDWQRQSLENSFDQVQMLISVNIK